MNDKQQETNSLVTEWQRFDQQFRHFQLLFVAVKAGIPAALAGGPLTLPQLSHALGFPSARLHRILRGLVWCGALATDGNTYALTSAGQALRDDSPQGLASNLRFQGEFFFNAWGHLWEYLGNGAAPFPLAHNGSTLFDLLNRDEDLAALFGAPMTARSTEQSAKIAAHPVLAALGDLPASLVVDVGGGQGRLLTEILTLYPSMQGLLLELPILENTARQRIAAENLAERCRFVPGDMFRFIPAGADAYLLKWVLHDWNDTDAARILQRCAEAMQQGIPHGHTAHLLIIERLMPEVVDSTNTGLVQADLNMLCQMNGAERTLTEYEALLAQAGLTLHSVQPLNDLLGFVVLEAVVSENR